MVLQPTREISLTIDYYNIKRRNEIAVKSVDETLANEDRIAGLVQRDPLTTQDIELAQRAFELSGKKVAYPIGPIKTIAAQYENVGKTKMSGVDIDVSGRWSLGAYGKLNLGLEVNRQFELRGWDAYDGEYTQNYVGWRGTPRTIAVAKSAWDSGPLTTGLRANFYEGTELGWGELDSNNTLSGCAARKVAPEACKIASDTTVDFWGKYKFGKSTVLSMNLFNVFNKASVVQMRPGSGLPLRHRTLMVTLEHKFF